MSMGQKKRRIEDLTEQERLDALWRVYRYVLYYRPEEEQEKPGEQPTQQAATEKAPEQGE